MQTPPARGRAAELKVIDHLVSRLLAGHSSVLVIEGAPGIGKTRLVTEVAARTVHGGGRCLWGTGFEHQRTVPFGPLFSATLGADPPVGDADALRALGANADLRYWVVHDLQSAIADAAAVTPLSIAIDDAHLADTGTLAALRMLMAGLADARVLWVLATRGGPASGPVREVVDAAVSGTDHATHLRLSSVDPDAAAGIAADALGCGIDESLLRLVAMAQGNPFLILELVLGLREEHRIHVVRGRACAVGEALPRRLLATMDDRLSELSPLTRQVVEVAAVLPERFSATLLAKMLERRPTELVGAISEAIRADLLVDENDHLKFRHHLLRHAARDTIPRALRRALERDSAASLLETGAAPEEVATQLARSAEVGDIEAVQSLRSAARSLARADVSGAAQISRQALDLVGSDDELRGALTVESIDLFTRAARFAEAEALASLALSTGLPAKTEAQIRLAVSTMPTLWPDERIVENRRILALPNVTPAIRRRNQVWLAHNLMLDGHAAAGPAARTALERLTDVDDVEIRTLAATTVASVALAEGTGYRCSAILDDLRGMAGRIGGGSTAGQRATVVYASLLVGLGRLGEATAVIAEALAAAESQQQDMTVDLLTVTQAMCDFAAGRLVAARAALRPMFEQQPVECGRMGNLVVLAHLSWVAVQLDDRSLIRETGIMARNALKYLDHHAVRHHSTFVLASAAWQRDDIEGAAALLSQDTQPMSTPLWPVDLDHLVLTARVAAATNHQGLQRQTSTALELLEREDPGTPLFIGVARHLRGLLHHSETLLDEAERTLRECERPLMHAAALEDSGSVTDQREHAVDRLNEAFDVYGAHGAVTDARRVSRRLHVLGVSRRVVRPRARAGWDSLTVSELRVVELVAEGATNPQAAKRLGVSPHTVNTHLRNAYTKLKISSRAELVRLARGAG